MSAPHTRSRSFRWIIGSEAWGIQILSEPVCVTEALKTQPEQLAPMMRSVEVTKITGWAMTKCAYRPYEVGGWVWGGGKMGEGGKKWEAFQPAVTEHRTRNRRRCLCTLFMVLKYCLLHLLPVGVEDPFIVATLVSPKRLACCGSPPLTRISSLWSTYRAYIGSNCVTMEVQYTVIRYTGRRYENSVVQP